MSEKSLSEVHESVDVNKTKGRFRKLLAFIGPAYLVSVGYMDPGNWATDIAGGSRFGYSLIWILLMSNLMALLLQSLAARLGIVKGWDLAQASRQQYPTWVNVSLYAFAEIAIAATDLAEIIGMAIGLNLLFDLPLLWGVVITVFDTFLLLFLLNKGIRRLELFIISLVAIIGLSFIAQMFIVQPEIVPLMKGFIPGDLSGEALYIAIGIIGATVMPHNLYLHSSLVQTRRFSRDEQGIRTALKFNFIDSTIALNAAFFVNAAILVLAASAFYKNGYNQVADISNAHELLKGLFGNLAPTLFAIALIAAGQSSTVTGTLAGQIVMEGYLNLRISPWLRRIITRTIAVAPAVFTILYLGEEKLGELLILSQVVLSIQLGFAIVPLIHFSSSKAIMGEFRISKWMTIVSWIVAIVIIGLNMKLVIEEVSGFLDSDYGDIFILKLLVLLVVVFAVSLLIWIIAAPLFKKIIHKQIIPHGGAMSLKLKKVESFKNIGIAVDFTSTDMSSISYAIHLGGIKANYVLIHVVESAAARQYEGQVEDSETKADREYLLSYTNELSKKGYSIKPCLGFGNRVEAISKFVKEENTDLLIMGAHGHQTMKDFIFGSTVESVRHKLEIPVLVVK
jgi:manganese transport protein